MRLTPRRLLVPAAALACILTIGAALIPREAAVGSDINDLQTAPAVYNGFLFSNTDPGLQGEFFPIQVTNVVGNKYTGITVFEVPIEGSVTAAGKFKLKVDTSKAAAAGRRGPGILGSSNFQLTLTGQISEGGNAIIGTYKLKNPELDKGTFYMVPDD